jgi:hypothetical protein
MEDNVMKTKGFIIFIIFLISSGLLYLFNENFSFSTYNDNGIYFQYPSNDWKLSDNNSIPLIISTNINGDRIIVQKFKHLNSVQAYSTGATNELQQRELYVKDDNYIGNLTDNKTNIIYRYYITYITIPNDFGGNITSESVVYLFEKNGNAYDINGYFTVDPTIDNSTDIQTMNTILETIN